MPSRSAVSNALRAVWTPEDRAAYRQAIGGKASMGGQFAQCLRNAMRQNRAGVDAYRQCAQQAGIAERLAQAWRD